MLALALKGIQLSLFVGVLALAWTAVASFARTRAPELPNPPASAAERPALAQADYQLIAERNLFAAAEPPTEPAPPPAEEVVESQLNVKLLGTVVAGADRSDGFESSALVRDTDGVVLALAIGDKLASGAASVVGIESRRILIEHRDRVEAVLLSEEAKAGRRRGQLQVPGARPRPDRDGIAMLQQAQMGTNAEMLNLIRMITPLGRFTPDRGEDGSIDGFRVTAVYDESPLQDLGVSVGDRLLSLNGIPLGGDTAALGALASLADGSDPVVTIEDSSGSQREIVLPRELLRLPGGN